MEESFNELSLRLIDGLAQRRYSAVGNALPITFVHDLKTCLNERSLRPARVGTKALEAPEIRNDDISWIDESDLKPAEISLFAFFEKLRRRLNQELFLGLTDFEAHYARYDAGHFYAKHVDRFNDNNARVISVVLYLNENWTESDGGSLKLSTTPPTLILPQGGTLVCFTSEDIEHEVLPAHRTRLSIAAWFRRSK